MSDNPSGVTDAKDETSEGAGAVEQITGDMQACVHLALLSPAAQFLHCKTVIVPDDARYAIAPQLAAERRLRVRPARPGTEAHCTA